MHGQQVVIILEHVIIVCTSLVWFEIVVIHVLCFVFFILFFIYYKKALKFVLFF